MISDLEIARLCSAIYTDHSVFDYIDDGSKTGIFFGIKKYDTFDSVTFRGSTDIPDWERDFEAETVFQYDLGYVHAGFNKYLDSVHQELDDLIRPHCVLNGHSKGAGHASILAGRMAVRHNPPLHVALFGCPRPGCEALVSATKDLSINSYRNRQDPITAVPKTFPDFPYTDLRPFIPLDGAGDTTFNLFMTDHHILNYVNGMEKLNEQLNSGG